MSRGFAVGNHAPDSHLIVQGCEVAWPLLQDNVAPGAPPTNSKCLSAAETYHLIPYGAAKVHMSELPVIDLSDSSSNESRVAASRGTAVVQEL